MVFVAFLAWNAKLKLRLYAMTYYHREKSTNCSSIILGTFDETSHVNASIRSNSIAYWPCISMDIVTKLWILKKMTSVTLIFEQFWRGFFGFGSFFHLYSDYCWLVYLCLIISYDALHECGVRIRTIKRVQADLFTVLFSKKIQLYSSKNPFHAQTVH